MAGVLTLGSLQAANDLPELGEAASEELSLAAEKRIGQLVPQGYDFGSAQTREQSAHAARDVESDPAGGNHPA